MSESAQQVTPPLGTPPGTPIQNPNDPTKLEQGGQGVG